MTLLELYNSPDKWTKGALARDKYGIITTTRSPAAVSFCLAGALSHCYPDSQQYEEARTKLETDLIPRSLVDFNDAKATTFEDILKVIKEAGV